MASYADEAWVNSTPPTPVDKVLMQICDEQDFTERETVELPSIKTDVHFVRKVDTREVTRQITGSLRRVNATDPFLPSARVTPNHEFAVVPRRETTQLPPRLGDDTADAPEHVTSVEMLINAKVAAFHVNEQRLPHRIKVSFIRFCQNWITTHDDEHFNYKGVPIPITRAAIGEFAVDEVRLD